MGTPTLATPILLLGIALAPSAASQSKPTSKPRKPDAEALKQAHKWVTFLELDDRRGEAADALLKMGADAVPALLLGLNDPRPVVVQRVAHILRVLGSLAAGAKERLVELSKSKDKRLAEAARYALAGVQPAGITLVANHPNKVLELDKAGKVVRTLAVVRHPWDAERLPNGNYLICGFSSKNVVEVTKKSEVVWSYNKLKMPLKAQRLPNGNTLITDVGKGVLEVDRAGKIVWQYGKDGKDRIVPRDAERLLNGNTLIAHQVSKVIEVTRKGEIVWEHKIGGQFVYDADRLPNGNTLIVHSNPDGVIEVTPKGKVVHELKILAGTARAAHRLPNGHTVVAHGNEVAEYDTSGKKIWSTKVGVATAVSRY